MTPPTSIVWFCQGLRLQDHPALGPAVQRGLRRLMLVVPMLTPRLSSLWLGLVTPLYARVGRGLIDSIRHPTVVSDESALRMFCIRPKGVRETIAMALRHMVKSRHPSHHNF